MKDEQTPPVEGITVTAEPGKVIPKLANKVAVARPETGDNIIITFLSDMPGEQAYLVERIVIDQRLADNLNKLLQRKEKEGGDKDAA